MPTKLSSRVTAYYSPPGGPVEQHEMWQIDYREAKASKDGALWSLDPPLTEGKSKMVSTAPPLIDEPPVIVLVGADKGGVGKTTVARALADYLQAAKPRLIDTQAPAGDLRGFYPKAEILDLSSTTAQMHAFDNPGPLTIIDVGAGMLTPTIAMLERVGILNDVRAGAVRLVLLYLLGPSVASLSEVVEANRTIAGKLELFFVKNHVNATDYFGWEKDPRFGEALAAMKPRMVDVPQLNEVAAETVQQRGQPFSTFAADTSNSRILRGYVADWMARVRAEIDRVGVGQAVAVAR